MTPPIINSLHHDIVRTTGDCGARIKPSAPVGLSPVCPVPQFIVSGFSQCNILAAPPTAPTEPLPSWYCKLHPYRELHLGCEVVLVRKCACVSDCLHLWPLVGEVTQPTASHLGPDNRLAWPPLPSSSCSLARYTRSYTQFSIDMRVGMQRMQHVPHMPDGIYRSQGCLFVCSDLTLERHDLT